MRTLRARLLIAMISLLAVAVLIIDVTAVTTLRSFLTDQVDQELTSARGPIRSTVGSVPDGTERPDGTRRPPPPGVGGGRGIGFSDYYIEIRRSDGSVETQVSPLLRRENEPAPDVPATLAAAQNGKQPFTVGAVGDNNTKYRAIVTTAQDGSGTVIVAAPLKSIDDTVDRLVGVEIIATLTALLVLAAIGWWIIRTDLRPLEQMAQTASAIAAGDMSKRVEREDTVTEVGRLGMAMNTMLTQIEGSLERLRRFAADASHELRTPLTSIRGYAELYRQGAVQTDEDVARVMGRIESEAARMGLMVDDLLVLARLDQGRPMERDVVNLNDLAADAVSDARVSDPSRTIDVTHASDAVTVLGDAPRLHQILANLLSNALVHTSAGTPVTVRVSRDGDDAVLEVIDEGPGLEPEAKAKVFERFYRVDAGRSRDTGGTGLGLAIVHSLVVAHGGTVTVESEPGNGATFIVRIPANHD